MIITLTGTNTFLLRDKLTSLTKEFRDTHGTHELEQLDGTQVELDKAKSALESLPFLSDKKCIVLHEPQSIAGFTDEHEAILSGVSDSVEVIIVEPSLDKRTKYAKYLQKHTQYHDFRELGEAQLIDWVIEAAQRSDATIDRRSAQYLVNRVGVEQFTLYNEVQKLATYDGKITKETIDLLTEQAPQSSIFELIDAVFSGNVHKALQLYEDQRAQKEEPPKILYMMVRQMHIIALVSVAPPTHQDNDIAKEAKLHPFVVQKARQSARRLSRQALQQCVSELREIDRLQKTKSVQLDELLRSFIVSLSHLQQQ